EPLWLAAPALRVRARKAAHRHPRRIAHAAAAGRGGSAAGGDRRELGGRGGDVPAGPEELPPVSRLTPTRRRDRQKPICSRPSGVRSSNVARPSKSTSKSIGAKSGAERPSRNAAFCFGR